MHTDTPSGTVFYDSYRRNLYCKIGMDKIENSVITTVSYDVPTVSHDAPTVSLRIHYDS